jgi:hypothetical protein
MPEHEGKSYKILDWLILSFFVIFILSLSNSIFVNQVGYFGALLFILIKVFLTRKNQFSKTGLEFAFALYMIAEILSLIFSDYKAEALHHFSKRALLIPVFYTTITVTNSFKRGKTFFYIFIAASLVTCIVYLIVSVKYYLNNQYVITQSGPALIQNPITTSEIISFTVLFLFAFIINEKTEFKTKLLLYAGFAISLLTLIATYKRTGWMGVAVGLVLLLIIKKKWKILIPVFILGIFLLITDKNISQVNVYDFENSKASKLFSFNTDGRACSVSKSDSFFVISDYENGLLFYKDTTLIKRIETPEPATSFLKIKDNLFLAQLVDTRFLVLKRDGNEIKKVKEILPPGITNDFILRDESLYILDTDSGLTLYESLESNFIAIRFPQYKGYKWLFADSSKFIFASEDSGITVFSREGLLPGRMIINKKIGDFKRMHVFDDNILIGNSDGLILFTLEKNEIVLKDHLKQLNQIHRMENDGGMLAVLCSNGTLYKLKVLNNSRFKILAQDKVSPAPTNFNFFDGKLYCTYVNRGRLLSFFDPYLSQNFTRLALWRAGWKIFKDYPLFGVGDIDLAKYYLKYKRPSDKEIHGHLHNNYIHFLVTLGLVGFLALGYLFIRIITKIVKIYKSSKGKPFIASYSLGALASFVSILIAGLSELNFWDQEIATLIYFTVGLNVALFIHYKNENEGSKEEIK